MIVYMLVYVFYWKFVGLLLLNVIVCVCVYMHVKDCK